MTAKKQLKYQEISIVCEYSRVSGGRKKEEVKSSKKPEAKECKLTD